MLYNCFTNQTQPLLRTRALMRSCRLTRAGLIGPSTCLSSLHDGRVLYLHNFKPDGLNDVGKRISRHGSTTKHKNLACEIVVVPQVSHSSEQLHKRCRVLVKPGMIRSRAYHAIERRRRAPDEKRSLSINPSVALLARPLHASCN